MRQGLADIVTELEIEATPAGFGGVFALYFTKAPVLGYRDLMRNNDAAYVAFHRGMTDRGFLMLPMSLKRNHVSGEHTSEEIDRTLEAARDSLKELKTSGIV
jgi:glutamate-1-semialdehyde 2,1-aminomutase